MSKSTPEMTRILPAPPQQGAAARVEELEATLRSQRDYLIGLSAYLATCAPTTIIESLETTITSLHKQRAEAEKLLTEAIGGTIGGKGKCRLKK